MMSNPDTLPGSATAGGDSEDEMLRQCRILIVDNGEGLWGAQQVVLRIGPYLTESGCELILAAPDDALSKRWSSAGKRWLPTRRTTGLRAHPSYWLAHMASTLVFVMRSFLQAIRLARMVRRENIDVVVGNSSGTHLESVLAGRFCRTPTIVVLHEQMANQLMRSLVVALATRSIAVSESVHRDLPKRVRKSNVVIHNGVDVDRFSPGDGLDTRRHLSIPDVDLLVGYVGRLDESKQVEHVVESVSRLRNEGVSVHLLIVGAPSKSPEYADAVRAGAEAKLGDSVSFIGAVTDVTEILRTIDVAVFPGRMEGMSLGLLEALSVGRAVVAYRASGVNEVIEDGRTGRVVAMGDIDHLTEAIRELCESDDMRVRLGRAARESMVTRFSADTQGREYRDLIASVRR